MSTAPKTQTGNNKSQILKEASTFIAKHEGLETTTYLDAVGMPTIGYGDTEWLKANFKTKEEMLTQTITKEFALELLQKRIEEDYKFLLSLVKVNLNINQTVALLSLIFNIGRTAFKNSTLLKKLNKTNNTSSIYKGENSKRNIVISNDNILSSDNTINNVYYKQEDVADEFLRWKYAGGKVFAGLVKRREEEREGFLR